MNESVGYGIEAADTNACTEGATLRTDEKSNGENGKTAAPDFIENVESTPENGEHKKANENVQSNAGDGDTAEEKEGVSPEEKDSLTEKEAYVPVDYEQMMRDDLRELRASFPELSALRDISELSGALRYAALRDLGLSATEAYLATSHRAVKRDNRSHLSSAISHTAGTPRTAMTRGELSVARELFSGYTDTQIYDLYKRVTQ